MAITSDDWMTIWENAGVLKEAYGTRAVSHGIIGRSISSFAAKLENFWTRHQDTLIPFLTQFAIATLNAVVAAKADINAVNPPGPE
jgi:hypothetical protein